MTQLRCAVDVATMWAAPESPRDLDAGAVADRPDLEGWLGGLGFADRYGLHGRTLTQLAAGEPVELLEERGDWARVAALWQPDLPGEAGYVGWVRRAHLRVERPDEPEQPAALIAADPDAVLADARTHLGLPYLWGGTSAAGLDCSGLVHLTLRRAGLVCPRDADKQQRAAAPVALGEEQPGDLMFFGSSLDDVSHVGFVSGPGLLLHATENSEQQGEGTLLEEPLTDRLRAALLAAGRVLP